MFPGLSACLEKNEERGFDREYAITFLLGLYAVQVWYTENREVYESAKTSADGNSKYSDRNWVHVNLREANNKFAKRDKECQIILGYMDACGSEKVSKPFIDPLEPCIRHILRLPNYFERKLKKTRSSLQNELGTITDEDVQPYVSEFEKYHKTQIYKRVWQRVEDYVSAVSSYRIALKESQKLFSKIHSSRTSVL